MPYNMLFPNTAQFILSRDTLTRDTLTRDTLPDFTRLTANCLNFQVVFMTLITKPSRLTISKTPNDIRRIQNTIAE